ncbi:dopamine receptor 2-like [Ptychodera flava]|uniref:dopamine receptor 2-like n=1 Tax=Ptychodera flava TaxID=63121 RepID=UPI00396A3724
MNSTANSTLLEQARNKSLDFAVGFLQPRNISVILSTRNDRSINETAHVTVDYLSNGGYYAAAGEPLSSFLEFVNLTVNITKGGPLNDTADAFGNSSGVANTVSAGKVLLGLFLCLCCLVMIIGNILIMVAVSRMTYLRTVTNFFIVSLAVADLLVGSVIVPFTITLAMTDDHWPFGVVWCDMWRSFDVLSATASILNLSAISLDRYWAITDPMTYPGKMSFKRAYVMIFLVWFCSAAISFPAVVWWRSVDPPDNGREQCLFTDDTTYRIMSSCISFYIPLFVMAFFYYRIYRAAAIQTKSLKRGIKTLNGDADIGGGALTLRIHRGGGAASRTYSNHSQTNGTNSDDSEDSLRQNYRRGHRMMPGKRLHISKRLIRLAREKKAAKTLGIVMGVFIICWLPFFVLNVLYGVCGDICVAEPELLYNLFTWLGYLNSGVNPFIYAFSSRDFKRAFIKILCTCLPRTLDRQMRSRQTLTRRNNSNTFSMTVETTILAV